MKDQAPYLREDDSVERLSDVDNDVSHPLSLFQRDDIDIHENSFVPTAISDSPDADNDGAKFDTAGSGSDSDTDFNQSQYRSSSDDSVRLYLYEMGRTPLLKREDEVVLAKRMERGNSVLLKAISRSPVTVREWKYLGARRLSVRIRIAPETARHQRRSASNFAL